MHPSQTAPKAVQPSPQQPSPPASMKAAIVQNIPVKSQVDSVVGVRPQPTNNPVARQTQQAAEPPSSAEDRDLDRILQDVNSSVKKAAVKKAQIDEAPHGSPPILATVLALAVAAGLIAAAVMMFRTSA